MNGGSEVICVETKFLVEENIFDLVSVRGHRDV